MDTQAQSNLYIKKRANTHPDKYLAAFTPK